MLTSLLCFLFSLPRQLVAPASSSHLSILQILHYIELAMQTDVMDMQLLTVMSRLLSKACGQAASYKGHKTITAAFMASLLTHYTRLSDQVVSAITSTPLEEIACGTHKVYDHKRKTSRLSPKTQI
jgi:hypothetical protein